MQEESIFRNMNEMSKYESFITYKYNIKVLEMDFNQEGFL